MSKQPEALRLAEHLESFRSFDADQAAAAELRRLHAENAELTALLKEAVPHLADIVRMPNAEWVADAHNKAADALRQALAKAEGGV
jgi:hypothetical protein